MKKNRPAVCVQTVCILFMMALSIEHIVGMNCGWDPKFVCLKLIQWVRLKGVEGQTILFNTKPLSIVGFKHFIFSLAWYSIFTWCARSIVLINDTSLAIFGFEWYQCRPTKHAKPIEGKYQKTTNWTQKWKLLIIYLEAMRWFRKQNQW